MRVSTLIAAAAGCAQAFVLPQTFLDAFQLSSGVDEQSFFWPHKPYFLKHEVDPESFPDDIELAELNSTAWDLYQIAGTSNRTYGHPTRVIGSEGHWNTLNYILRQFDEMRDYYEISTQSFKALNGKVYHYDLNYTNGAKVPTAQAFSLSPPAAPFVGKLVEIPNLGCTDADFEALTITEDSIALIERGECPFGKKSSLAGKHGFKAVVIYDNDPTSEKGVSGTLEKPTNHTVSTVGVSFAVGQELILGITLDPHFSLFYYMDSYVNEIETKNIIADTKHGDPENIVALGAHTDSVAAGPGINDDGSGTISLLAVAKHLSNYKINNKVRFAFWAAEEEGLVGSNYYAEHLTPEENLKMRLFMDYDMMASPNYQYQIYDANNIDNPRGSEELRDLYIDYYTEHGLNYTLIPFDGRSDYVGFIEHGIPGGGIAAGAEGKNTDNGKVLDRCYHELCDDVNNLNWEAFLTNTQLIAYSVARYADSLKGFPEREINATVTASSADIQYKYPYKGGANLLL
ncbi:LANO_0F05996g1_1 [Lachancea nothofagi CBS 11611]|uniref:Peptide hydrolase n=1 Tax=Lachancea nothofagi CBS 11611 TaxID=1266666 RepID=A0A1G4K8B9_9SACH|nr:LANO_0F05996g1_1 [Lachancea nothofagi CBS 11611]